MKKTLKTLLFTTALTLTFSFSALASVYSTRWETQADGQWKYKMDDGSYATNKWLQDEVDQNWYLLDDSGVMRSGVYKSYGKYYLLSEIHDGHFGHLVKNGEVYQGVTIQASTNKDDEGALTQETITALKSAGFNFDSVQDVSGTSHVTDGQVSYEANTTTQSQAENVNNTSYEVGGMKVSTEVTGNIFDPNATYTSGANAYSEASKKADENFLKNR